MSKKRDDIGTRMKTFYEETSKTRLLRRTPVAIRIDGKSFHTFTRGFARPYDGLLMACMQQTTKFLCENIQGCVFGYTQSDEITLILADYQTLATSAWFDYEVQKLCSVSASMATMAFNRALAGAAAVYAASGDADPARVAVLDGAVATGAMFDARCFNVPREEVVNLVYWRQLDAMKNSVQLLGREHFSTRELHRKGASAVKQMLKDERGIDWDDMSTPEKIGAACIRGESGWVIDEDMPLLKGDGRDYLGRLIEFDDEGSGSQVEGGATA